MTRTALWATLGLVFLAGDASATVAEIHVAPKAIEFGLDETKAFETRVHAETVCAHNAAEPFEIFLDTQMTKTTNGRGGPVFHYFLDNRSFAVIEDRVRFNWTQTREAPPLYVAKGTVTVEARRNLEVRDEITASQQWGIRGRHFCSLDPPWGLLEEDETQSDAFELRALAFPDDQGAALASVEIPSLPPLVVLGAIALALIRRAS